MKWVFLLFALILSFPVMSQREKNYPLLLIRDLSKSKADTFRVRATVTSIATCPPCPKGAMCKPCLGNHITVMNNNDSLRIQLVVFTDNPDQFARGRIYQFTLSMRNKAKHEDAELVSFHSVQK
jgi:hypothetical protein